MSQHREEQWAAQAKGQRQQYQRSQAGLTAYERHKKFIRDYQTYYGGQLPPQQQTLQTDYDVLRSNYRFIRSPDEDRQGAPWEVRLAKRYYDKLFKEYCIADLSRYKESKVGLRWRTEKEVVAGKGQFICGAVGCSETKELASFEVHFAYHEAGEYKQALVKLRLCPAHALHLNYRKTKETLRDQKAAKRKQRSGNLVSVPKRSKGSAAGTESASEDSKEEATTVNPGAASSSLSKSRSKLKVPEKAEELDDEESFEGMFL